MSDPQFTPHFCCRCGAEMEQKIPEGENRIRSVCPSCGFIHYINPLPVCGTLPVWKDRVLLCRRAIEPRKNFWTLPGGFLEKNEPTSAGALRETMEEAGIRVKLRQLYSVMDVPFASHIHIYYLADMLSPEANPGPESLECRLFAEEEIPWDEIAFGTAAETLKCFFRDRKAGRFSAHHMVFADNWHLMPSDELFPDS